MTTAILVENVSKSYRLGTIGRGTLGNDLSRWWARLRGQPDPLLKIGQESQGNQQNEYIWALRDVCLRVKQGEAVGIIGRNGAGKSTLLKILSRVTAPTSGSVKSNGRIASLLEVGTGFHPELTGRDNIFLNGAIMGMSRAEVTRKFDEIVDFSGVEKFIDTPVKRYSSGMYVRLAFAVAAHLEPEILVVDEVLAVGDAEFQKKCLGKMGDVSSTGRTVLFVSHNMSAINRLCRRAVLLDAGQLVEDGVAEQVTNSYLSLSIEGGAKKTWDLDHAPTVKGLKILSFGVFKKDGNASGIFDVHDELILKIEYEIENIELSFSFLAAFYTKGILAFLTKETKDQPRPHRGRFVSTATIPAHLLAETDYLIQISVLSGGYAKGILRVGDTVSFIVYDSMTGTSARGDSMALAGVVSPLLKWDTESV